MCNWGRFALEVSISKTVITARAYARLSQCRSGSVHGLVRDSSRFNSKMVGNSEN